MVASPWGKVNVKKRHSVSTVAILCLVLVATSVLGAFGYISCLRESEQRWANLRGKLTSSADQLSVALAIPMWNLDRVQIKKIIESEMHDPEVLAVRVDDTGKTYEGGNPAPGNTEQPLSEKHEITFSGEVIGSVEVFVTPKLVLAALSKSRLQFGLLILLVDLTLILSIYLVLWKVILLPLRRLESYALAVRSGGSETSPQMGPTKLTELESLRVSIERMVALLERRFREAKASEEIYKTLFACEPDSLLIIDRDSLHVLDANDAALSMYGYYREEMLERSVLELSAEPEATKSNVVSMHPGNLIRSATRKNRRKDGSVFPADISIRAFMLHGRVALVTAVRDVTERVMAENALYAAKENAEAADKLKSQFLDVAAHELKTPLTPLLLLLQLVQRNGDNPSALTPEIWPRINRQLEHLNGLVNDLLEVSRLDLGLFAFRPQFVDLNELVSQSVDDFRRMVTDRKVTLARSIAPLEVELDPVEIKQVLFNLLDNAAKYTPPLSPIEVAISPSGGRRVKVSVTDHGQGISPQQQKTLFTRFFRVTSSATRKHSGLGLGLYVCRRILELHRGSIGVESDVGQGSKFEFEIPISRTAA